MAADAGIADKVKAALDGAGIDAEIELIDGGDCEVRARAVAERGDELLIVGGGDGTIGAAASALVGTGTKLGILPLGTLNHFARDLGIPPDLDEAAKLIAAGKERRVDVAEMNGRIFINNSAIGLYPLMVVDRDAQQKRLGRSKRLAMLVASIRTLARFRHQRLTPDRQRRAKRGSTRLCCSSATTTIGSTSARRAARQPRRRRIMRARHAQEDSARTGRGEHPRVARPHARRRHGAHRRCRAAAGREPPLAISPFRSTAKWCAPPRRSTIRSARGRCGSSRPEAPNGTIRPRSGFAARLGTMGWRRRSTRCRTQSRARNSRRGPGDHPARRGRRAPACRAKASRPT